MTGLAPFPGGWQKATVIVAHPDDIEWGIAGAGAAWTAAGRTVSYVLVTSVEAGIDTMSPAEAPVARQTEERASGAVVGVTEIEFLGHPDGRGHRGSRAAAGHRRGDPPPPPRRRGQPALRRAVGVGAGEPVEQRRPPRRGASDDGRRRRRRQPLDLP